MRKDFRIRCIATKLKQEPPQESSLTAMVRQRLDALAIITLTGIGFERRGGGATGYIEEVYLAHLLPQQEDNGEEQPYWTVSPPTSLEQLVQQDFLDLVEGLEAEFQREYIAQKVDQDRDRVLVVGLMTDKTTEQQFQDGLTELALLLDTAGGQVLHTISQKRSRPHPQTVVGTGKVEEIALKVQTLGANLVAFNQNLSPAQVRNLESSFGVRVVDRTEVILDIFAQRARSRAGKLQVELAQLELYPSPSSGGWKDMSRLGGGIGTRGREKPN